MQKEISNNEFRRELKFNDPPISFLEAVDYAICELERLDKLFVEMGGQDKYPSIAKKAAQYLRDCT